MNLKKYIKYYYYIFTLIIPACFALYIISPILPARSADVDLLSNNAPDAPLIRVGDADAKPGEKININISLENNPGFISMILHLVYDRSVLTLTNVKDAGALGETEQNPDFDLYPYILSWSADTRSENYSDNAVLAVLEFEIKQDAPAGDYTVSVWYNESADEILNLDLKPVKFETQNGTIHTGGSPGTVNPSYPAITGITRRSDGIEIAVNGTIPASGGKIFCAVYDRRGRLSALSGQILSSGRGIYHFSPDGAADGFIKAFLTDSNGVPLCESRRG